MVELRASLAASLAAFQSGAATPALLVLDADLPEPKVKRAAAAAAAAGPDAHVVLATSGSAAGDAKLVGLSWPALLASARLTTDFLRAHYPGGRGAESAWVVSLPLHHIAGLQIVVRALQTGAPAVWARSAAEISRAASELTGHATYISLVPTQLARLTSDSALRDFAAILVGGAPLSAALASGAEALPLVMTYGMTETCGGCVYNGDPLPGVRVRIIDDCVWLAGPTLMAGYLGSDAADPVEQPFSWDRNGTRWLRTGDRGRLLGDTVLANEIEEGRAEIDEWPPLGTKLAPGSAARLEILGRADDVILSGGESIAAPAVARVIEEVLPGYEAQVLGVDDDLWGQLVTAFLLPPKGNFAAAGAGATREGDGATAASGGAAAAGGRASGSDPAELGRYLRESVSAELGSAAAPRQVFVLQELPLLPTGKVDRRALRALRAGSPAVLAHWKR